MINKSEPEWVYKYNSVDEINKEASKIKKKYTVLGDKLNLLDRRLREICKHEKTETTSSYIEGGYLNVAEYIKTTTCIICGAKLGEKVTYGDHA